MLPHLHHHGQRHHPVHLTCCLAEVAVQVRVVAVDLKLGGGGSLLDGSCDVVPLSIIL